MNQDLGIIPDIVSARLNDNVRGFETQNDFNIKESWAHSDMNDYMNSYPYDPTSYQKMIQGQHRNSNTDYMLDEKQYMGEQHRYANRNMDDMPNNMYIDSSYTENQWPHPVDSHQGMVHHNTKDYSHSNIRVAAAAASAITKVEPQTLSVNSSNLSSNLSSNYVTAPSRTVYLGNIPPTLTASDLLDHVRSGVIEEVKILPEKMCAFISFLDENSSLLFHSDAILKRLNIDGKDIKIGWGKPSPLSPIIATSVATDGATRNIFIGQLNTTDHNKQKDNDATIYHGSDDFEDIMTEEKLRKDLEEYGDIDCIKIFKEKGFAFVHFTSILSAIKVVNNLSNSNPYYSKKKIYYGKDRCAFITKTQKHNAAQFLGIPTSKANSLEQTNSGLLANALLQQSAAAAAIATSAGGSNNLGNRTVYLGNLPNDIRIEDICNTIRCGLLQNIKLLSDRHVCFVTFIDPVSAAQFYAMSSIYGFVLQKKRCKVGWGKHSGPLSNPLTLAVSNGASRNVYIGNIDFTADGTKRERYFTDSNLRRIFSEYGEVEQINFLYSKNCCFVNYTNINNAISAIDKIKNNPTFKNLKINFGKDRCGNIAH
ncbi:hypothetical protein TPHA_0J02210 [Tetrapisispora phaffii CBS 4417]|uniref:RRM domain-containing protein n=1 Tax=Tetrapisispora phaffii (strain ATCC 24235 / CBS 4417 / NBRC 1672 / NRRL Y-8282 / UCD 70-5) TaxID=1071381 RepID=G8BYU9_TETPH|nr:hypothetical protein TPHA_0J02210 [Tetrapisispora phaffii CBS 4417]CCE65041.1 hypothetical protein TPHA_0J02210 [Tetrapisispora phaffii CBS 4417]